MKAPKSFSLQAKMASIGPVLALGAILAYAIPARAVDYQQIYSFAGKPDAATPQAALLIDSRGILYGTTYNGGKYDVGTVFSLTPPAVPGGSWSEALLWSFGAGASDGQYGVGPLVADSGGNLYGTTYAGGDFGAGTVFELGPAGARWNESILRDFQLAEGDPSGGVIRGSNGALFGNGLNGGRHNCGTVFALPPGGPGSVLTSFGCSTDGAYPNSGLLPAKGGGLYGTTGQIGTGDCGTVFQVTPAGGTAVETPIYQFMGFSAGNADGCQPRSGVISDRSGILYGTTTLGGAFDGGVVYSLTPPAQPGGVWTEAILYSFGAFSGDGISPRGNLVFGPGGVLYGTTAESLGEGVGTIGTVYSLSPPASIGGAWTETQIHKFSASGDGMNPEGGLALHDGVLFGTTELGGANNQGTVYAIAP